MNKINFLIFIFFICCGCKNQSNKNQLQIGIDLFSKTNDSVHLYYSTNETILFKESQSIWTSIIGKKGNQNINILLPKDLLVKQLRFDFGHNFNSQEIVINKLKFSFNNNNIVFRGKEIYDVFRIDETNTLFDKKNGVLKRKYVNQKAVFSIYPKGDKLFNRLNQLYSDK